MCDCVNISISRYRELQMNGDNKTVELKNDLKLKGFEVERTQMVHEETVRNLKESQLEIEKMQKKVEVGI
jgi:progesterone-induced-blocking factor 1